MNPWKNRGYRWIPPTFLKIISQNLFASVTNLRGVFVWKWSLKIQQLFTFFLRVFGIQDGTVAGVEGRYALRSLRDFDHHTGHHLLHLTCKDPLVSLDNFLGSFLCHSKPIWSMEILVKFSCSVVIVVMMCC